MAYARVVYHPEVMESHDSRPFPATQYAYKSVTYVTTPFGVSNSEWIIPGTLEEAEKAREKIWRWRAEQWST